MVFPRLIIQENVRQVPRIVTQHVVVPKIVEVPREAWTSIVALERMLGLYCRKQGAGGALLRCNLPIGVNVEEGGSGPLGALDCVRALGSHFSFSWC